MLHWWATETVCYQCEVDMGKLTAVASFEKHFEKLQQIKGLMLETSAFQNLFATAVNLPLSLIYIMLITY